MVFGFKYARESRVFCTQQHTHWYKQIYCSKCIHLPPKRQTNSKWKSNSLHFEIRIFGKNTWKKTRNRNAKRSSSSAYTPQTRKSASSTFHCIKLDQVLPSNRLLTRSLRIQNSISKLPTMKCELWSHIASMLHSTHTVMNFRYFLLFSWCDWIYNLLHFCTLENRDHAVRVCIVHVGVSKNGKKCAEEMTLLSMPWTFLNRSENRF